MAQNYVVKLVKDKHEQMLIPLAVASHKIGIKMKARLSAYLDAGGFGLVAQDYVGELKKPIHLICSGWKHLKNPHPQVS